MNRNVPGKRPHAFGNLQSLHSILARRFATYLADNELRNWFDHDDVKVVMNV